MARHVALLFGALIASQAHSGFGALGVFISKPPDAGFVVECTGDSGRVWSSTTTDFRQLADGGSAAYVLDPFPEAGLYTLSFRDVTRACSLVWPVTVPPWIHPAQ
ncbi:MAG: hypothetical protein AB1938_14520 [Myxococcota bacterium]